FAIMPELQWRYGYFGVLGLMAVLSIWMILSFMRRGWFK
ncbi:MAG TPA: magnesium and cobalt transport protein CorA, partial [Paenibacillus sp.]